MQSLPTHVPNRLTAPVHKVRSQKSDVFPTIPEVIPEKSMEFTSHKILFPREFSFLSNTSIC